MTAAQFLLRLLIACLPLIIIIVLCVAISRSSKKQMNIISADPLSGMRAPTPEESRLIMMQVMPRSRRKILAVCMVFIPLAFIVTCVILNRYSSAESFECIVLGLLLAGVICMFIGFLSLPLSEIRALRKDLYSVSDCRIGEVSIHTRFIHRSFIPCEIYHAVVKDREGYVWETDLPKDLRSVEAGTECLVMIYSEEEKINSRRKNGRYIYKRELYVPTGYGEGNGGMI